MCFLLKTNYDFRVWWFSTFFLPYNFYHPPFTAHIHRPRITIYFCVRATEFIYEHILLCQRNREKKKLDLKLQEVGVKVDIKFGTCCAIFTFITAILIIISSIKST